MSTRRSLLRLAAAMPSLALGRAWAQAAMPARIASSQGPIAVKLLADGFPTPTALVPLSDDRWLVAQRNPTQLWRVDLASGARHRLAGLPAIFDADHAGLHDVVPHPDFACNRLLYLCHTVGDRSRSSLAVGRARLAADASALEAMETLFVADAWHSGAYRYGGRLAFAEGHLFITVGDRERDDQVQSLASHIGKVLRLRDDGVAPSDNPFVGRDGALPEIWALGTRNAQGLAWDDARRTLWACEHGVIGGDELNRITRGANLGWPVTSWSFGYQGGAIGRGAPFAEGMTPPLQVWSPGAAPSDLIVYDGRLFAPWRGDLLMGSLAGQSLWRLSLREGRLVMQERLALELQSRIRSLRSFSDGALMAGTDDGRLLRLAPAVAAA